MKLEEIPMPIKVNTGEYEFVRGIVETFFENTRDYAREKYNLSDKDFSRKISEFAYRPTGIAVEGIDFILWRDEVLSGVLQTRTDSNRVMYTFFRELRGLENYFGKNKDSTKL